MEKTYIDFLDKKIKEIKDYGIEVNNLNEMLFDFQQDVVKWALKRGKAAVFAGTGLGKTAMQLEWSNKVYNKTKGKILILAPLAVSEQTVREGLKFGIDVNLCRDGSQVKNGINIINYEILHKFDCSIFDGIVLDESSILKSYSGKIRNQIIESFKDTKFKLACTATPAPNDYMELGNHCEFLDVMTRTEMLATFFVHDGGNTSKWRLKGHCENMFWDWVASWSVMINNPRDLGYENTFFDLPELIIHDIVVDKTEFGTSKVASTLQEIREVQQETLDLRVSKAAEIASTLPDSESVIVWCNRNDESEKLKDSIVGACEIKGGNDNDYKKEKMIEFSNSKLKRLVTKPSIAGFGMNWQNCNNMVFVGLNHSFEMYYQAVRRCWRAGQTKPVHVYIVSSEKEGKVIETIKRKEIQFEKMIKGIIS